MDFILYGKTLPTQGLQNPKVPMSLFKYLIIFLIIMYSQNNLTTAEFFQHIVESKNEQTQTFHLNEHMLGCFHPWLGTFFDRLGGC